MTIRNVVLLLLAEGFFLVIFFRAMWPEERVRTQTRYIAPPPTAPTDQTIAEEVIYFAYDPSIGAVVYGPEGADSRRDDDRNIVNLTVDARSGESEYWVPVDTIALPPHYRIRLMRSVATFYVPPRPPLPESNVVSAWKAAYWRRLGSKLELKMPERTDKVTVLDWLTDREREKICKERRT
jgi:hypothetical protein